MEGRRRTAPPAVDLLIVGGLTVDSFADRPDAPGGSVLHATRAAAAAGLRVGVLTAAGTEPEALDGLRELERRTALLQVSRTPRTIRFRHESAEGVRRLVALDAGGSLTGSSDAFRPAAVLLAPVAAELSNGLEAVTTPGARSGAILQGWLRQLVPGRAVAPGSVAMLPASVVDRLAAFDLLCASTEDLAGDAGSPRDLVGRLRARVGGHPVLVLTDGERGAWIDHAGGLELVAPPEVVPGAALGAGDAFAALMMSGFASGLPPRAAAETAALEVVRFLRRAERRRIVVGDVHGARERLLGLLAAAQLVDEHGAWCGGRAELWCLGDLVDRGPDGIGVMELLVRLQAEAAAAGGRVECVLGNHEMALLAAHLMPAERTTGPGGTFRGDWLANGGRDADLARLTPALVAWLRERPAMALLDGDLLVHADNTLYAELGADVTEVNAAVAALLAAPDPASWDSLLDRFAGRRAFRDSGVLAAFLAHFGATRVVHGHTPVPAMIEGGPAEADRPLHYASGRAVAADPGLYLGGPGFTLEL